MPLWADIVGPAKRPRLLLDKVMEINFTDENSRKLK